MKIPRKSKVFPKSWYKDVITAYEVIKGVKLHGSENVPLLQTCKTMFLNERLPKDIIGCMEVVNALYPDWSLNTVNMKIPDYIAGKLKNETLKVWYYDNQRAYMKGGKIFIICTDGEHREFAGKTEDLQLRIQNVTRDKSDAELQMENYMARIYGR
jgi:hypothetical protein